MSDKFSRHFLMTTEDVKEYAAQKLGFFGGESVLLAKEIGDGNINYVFKVWDEKSNKSIVIKQADILLRSSLRPLSLQRSKIEAEVLKIQGELASGFVPQVYDYNEAVCAIAMEDISDYKNLRKEMMAEKVFPDLAENISEFMAEVLLATTDLVLSSQEKKKRVAAFTNIQLCDISEDLVFTEPYYNYKNRNVIMQENLEFVKEQLYTDLKLKAEVGILRNNFMNNAQALIHGDLHSGSIFINDSGIKVIDPEFAFYGPMGYDVGNVLGNLILASARGKIEGLRVSFTQWIEKSIQNIFDMFFEKLGCRFDETVSFDLYKNQHFKNHYIKTVMSDSLGYAGTEIIRRTVGDSKVEEVTSVQDHTKRLLLERTLVLVGKRLIMQRQEIASGTQLICELKQILKDV